MSKNAEDRKYIQSVERARQMLSFVADQGCARLGAISEFSGLKTSTAFGLLQTLEHCGYHPELVAGRADNIKVTRPEDLALAEFYLTRNASMEN